MQAERFRTGHEGRSTRIMARALLGLLLTPAGCYDLYSLGIQGPPPPLAVGSTASYVLQYRKTFDCKSDRVVRCGAGNFDAITQTTEVIVDNPAILQATLQPDQQIVVRALAAGTSRLTAAGINAKGETVRADKTFSVLSPQQAVLDSNDLCAQSKEGMVRTVPVNGRLELTASVRNGGTELFSDGLSIPLDAGALLPGPAGSSPLTLQAPAMPTQTEVTSRLDMPYRLPVRVYEPSQIDGITLTPISPGPYRRQVTHTLRIDLLVQGDRVCQLADPPQERTVTILTQDTCVFRDGNDVTSMGTGFTFSGRNLSAVYVVSGKVGTCTLRTTVAGSALTSDFDLPITDA